MPTHSHSDAPLNVAPAGIETFRRRMADRSDVAPAELEQLMYAPDPGVREEAWAALIAKHSRLVLNVARGVAAEHDGVMDAYAYVLERLREDEYRRLRGYAADGRSAFSTWLVVVARRLCVDHYNMTVDFTIVSSGRCPESGLGNREPGMGVGARADSPS